VPSVSPPEPPSRDPLVVLVVEDEFLLALDLELVLERHGFRVLGPTATVAQALRLLEDGEPPDVALLDVNLRGELVTPVAAALRARGVPFVLASAYGSAQLLSAAVLAAAPKVSKPTSERRLLAALAEAVGR